MWPTTHSSPTVVGDSSIVWMTAPSWIDVDDPIEMWPSSPRSTAHGQIDDLAPMRTSPMITDSGWTKAVPSIVGSRSPRA